MASWAVLLSLSGFRWDAVENHLEFLPVIQPESFQCFFSTGSGWGVFRRREKGGKYIASVVQEYGTQTLQSFAVTGTKRRLKNVSVRKNKQTVESVLEVEADKWRFKFPSGLSLSVGDEFRIST